MEIPVIRSITVYITLPFFSMKPLTEFPINIFCHKTINQHSTNNSATLNNKQNPQNNYMYNWNDTRISSQFTQLS